MRQMIYMFIDTYEPTLWGVGLGTLGMGVALLVLAGALRLRRR
jgi:hypothetical protein